MMTIRPTIKEIKTIIFQLPVEEFLALMSAMEQRLETVTMMQLLETGFQAWKDPEEDIYCEVNFIYESEKAEN
jgi:hypothetical protein